jgi:AraC-like DNA-binding protein
MLTKAYPGTWVVEAMQRGGVDLARLAKRLPREFDHLLHVLDTTEPDDLVRLLEQCETLSGDANFGLHMAEYLELTRVGTYGYLLLNAPTIREFLELAARYYPLIYRHGVLTLSVSGRVARFQYAIPGPHVLDLRHINEWTIGYFAGFVRSRLDQPWHPDRTYFANKAPAHLEEQRQRFGDRLEFDASISGFEFDSALLENRITEANPVLLRIISRHADDLIQELGRKHPFRSRVRLLIMEGLEHGEAKANVVAKKLNLSLSSFKRQLSNAQRGCRARRDGIIKDLSQQALLETSLPLGDIALKMGYSELSAFTRAFTRLSGLSPVEYRRSAGNDAAVSKRRALRARARRSPAVR